MDEGKPWWASRRVRRGPEGPPSDPRWAVASAAGDEPGATAPCQETSRPGGPAGGDYLLAGPEPRGAPPGARRLTGDDPTAPPRDHRLRPPPPESRERLGPPPGERVASTPGPAGPYGGAPDHRIPALPAAPRPGPPPPAAEPGPWARYDPWARPAALTAANTRHRAGPLIVGAVVLSLVSGGVGGLVGSRLDPGGGPVARERAEAFPAPLGGVPRGVAGIAARALPSVVTLHVSGTGSTGTGTGFVLDDRGHILTNDHVVEPGGDSGEITVTFHGGDSAGAVVVGRDSGYDLAVVRVGGVSDLTPALLGDSGTVRVGDPVVAIGAPFDLAGTVTSGIISATERPITAVGDEGDGDEVSYVDALQTDAAINPGNSGGPLLDARGRVVGINSAIRSAGDGEEADGGQGGSIGLGFAIPINQGKRVAAELIDTGRATHPVIGVSLDMDYTGEGARVDTGDGDGGPPVSVGGPGDRAGIEPGDVITSVNGRRIRSGEELIVRTRAHRPGDRLELTLERAGETRTVSLVLGSSGGGTA
ncbi:trypsin-like peptidase domain-containing protein [Streptomyces sp. ZYX-F-203]